MDAKKAKERYRALEECLEVIDAWRRSFSLSGYGLSPKPGYEAAFEREAENRRVVQEMMLDLMVNMKEEERHG